MEMVAKVATINERSKATAEWREATDQRLQRMEDAQAKQIASFNELMAEIKAAKQVARAGTSVAGWIIKALPWTAAGSLGWLAALWAKN